MADRNPVRESIRSDELVLIFQYERPLQAEELGRAFTALARDYRRATKGRTLVVDRLERGSLIATLRDAAAIVGPYIHDAAELAKAVRSIGEFGAKLRSLILRVKETGTLRSKSKAVGIDSVAALMQIAADSKSEVKLKFVPQEGQLFEVKITPLEAIRAREKASVQRVARENQRLGHSNPRSLPNLAKSTLSVPPVADKYLPAGNALSPVLFGDGYPAPSGIAGVLAGIYSQGQGPSIDALISVVVDVLVAGGFANLIPEIAQNLEQRGLPDLAHAITSVAASSEGKSERL